MPADRREPKKKEAARATSGGPEAYQEILRRAGPQEGAIGLEKAPGRPRNASCWDHHRRGGQRTLRGVKSYEDDEGTGTAVVPYSAPEK